MAPDKDPKPLPPQPGFWSDLMAYARHSKKWWVVPLVLVLVIIGYLLLGASGAMAFVYTLF